LKLILIEETKFEIKTQKENASRNRDQREREEGDRKGGLVVYIAKLVTSHACTVYF